MLSGRRKQRWTDHLGIFYAACQESVREFQLDLMVFPPRQS